MRKYLRKHSLWRSPTSFSSKKDTQQRSAMTVQTVNLTVNLTHNRTLDQSAAGGRSYKTDLDSWKRCFQASSSLYKYLSKHNMSRPSLCAPHFSKALWLFPLLDGVDRTS